MNASFFINFPSQLHWSADELTEAFPMRLHELFAHDACSETPFASHNGIQTLPQRPDFLPAAPMPTFFRVR
jgi:hypothetical protein